MPVLLGEHPTPEDSVTRYDLAFTAGLGACGFQAAAAFTGTAFIWRALAAAVMAVALVIGFAHNTRRDA